VWSQPVTGAQGRDRELKKAGGHPPSLAKRCIWTTSGRAHGTPRQAVEADKATIMAGKKMQV
jgi:hypothetical protein